MIGIPPWVTFTVIGFLVVGVLVGMAVGWRRSTARTGSAAGVLPDATADLGAVLAGPIAAAYVATTFHERWLERVTAHGLGIRGRATVTVHEHALVIARNGAPDLVLPGTALRAVTRSSGMVGKFVADASIVVVTWATIAAEGHEVLLDTGLRPDRSTEREILDEAVRSIFSSAPAPKEQQ
ncbi:PH-like domain-containing protein [Sanguibacter sp. A247]|uniref:PH-like domain-containing protein n=1 Tax=unclassified Sanguibacter TaxID=2645534 RepID=UPI003FD8B885